MGEGGLPFPFTQPVFNPLVKSFIFEALSVETNSCDVTLGPAVEGGNNHNLNHNNGVMQRSRGGADRFE